MKYLPALLLLASCTYYVQEDESMVDISRGILGQGNKDQLGASAVYVPKLAKGGELIIVDTCENLSFSTLTAPDKWNPQDLTLAFSAFQLTDSTKGTSDWTNLQVAVQFSSGRSQFGNRQDPSVGVAGAGSILISPEVLIDMSAGSVIMLPADQIQSFTVRETAIRAAGFAANDIIGPSYRLNVGTSYGTPKSFAATVTEIPQTLIHFAVAGATIIIPKRQFAKSIVFKWAQYNTNAAITAAIGPLSIEFLTYNGTNILGTQIPKPGPLVPPEIDWPGDAAYVRCINLDAAADMTLFSAVQKLYL
jgi:hypothetical protein